MKFFCFYINSGTGALKKNPKTKLILKNTKTLKHCNNKPTAYSLNTYSLIHLHNVSHSWNTCNLNIGIVFEVLA